MSNAKIRATAWRTVAVSKAELMALIADHLETKNAELKIDRFSVLGILSVGQPEDEECWVSDTGVEVTFANIESRSES